MTIREAGTMRLGKITTLAAVFILLAGIPAAVWAETGEEGSQEPGYYDQTREKITEIQKGINDWWSGASKNMGEMSQDARESLNRTYQELQGKQGEAESRLSRMREGANEGFDKLREETDQAVGELNQAFHKAVGSLSAEEKKDQEKFREEARMALEKMDKKIDELSVWARERGGDAKVEVTKAMGALKEARARAWTRYRQVEAASGEKWDSVKDEAQKAMENLETTYGQTREKVKSYLK